MKSPMPFRLKNGLETIVTPARGLHSIGISVAVKCGAIDETRGKTGSANLLDKTLYKTKQSLEEGLDESGIMWFSQPGYAFTTHSMRVPLDRIGQGFGLLAELLSYGRLTRRILDAERSNVIEAIASEKDNSDYIPFRKVRSMMFGGRIGAPMYGKLEDVEKISVADVKHIYDGNYGIDRMVLSVYGQIDADKVIKEASGPFSALGDSHSRRRSLQKVLPEKPGEASMQMAGLTQAKFAIGFVTEPACGLGDEGFRSLSAMGCIETLLNERLFDEVRTKKGLAYNPFSQHDQEGVFGDLIVFVGTQPGTLGQAKEAAFYELQRLSDGEISQEDLLRAKKRRRAGKETELDDTMESASTMAYMRASLGDRMQLPDKYNREINLDDIRAAAQRYLRRDRAYFASVEPKHL